MELKQEGIPNPCRKPTSLTGKPQQVENRHAGFLSQWYVPFGMTMGIAEGRKSASSRPKPAHGNAVQVRGKRNDFGAGVQHDTAYPMFTGSGCQRLQTTHIVAAQGCGGLDLNPDNST